MFRTMHMWASCGCPGFVGSCASQTKPCARAPVTLAPPPAFPLTTLSTCATLAGCSHRTRWWRSSRCLRAAPTPSRRRAWTWGAGRCGLVEEWGIGAGTASEGVRPGFCKVPGSTAESVAKSCMYSSKKLASACSFLACARAHGAPLVQHRPLYDLSRVGLLAALTPKPAARKRTGRTPPRACAELRQCSAPKSRPL